MQTALPFADQTSFTPGPWRLHTYNQGRLLGYLQGSPIDGERYGDSVVLKFAKPTSARSHANARLIEAVPELYAELAAMIKREQQRYGGDEAGQRFFRENNAGALAALAKANPATQQPA